MVKAAREIARLATTADAERAAAALLAAAEYSDGTSQTDANEHPLILAMRKLDVSGKTTARKQFPVDRRTFLLAGGLSCLGADLAGSAMALADSAAGGATGSGRRKIAKSAIMIRLSGGRLTSTRGT